MNHRFCKILVRHLQHRRTALPPCVTVLMQLAGTPQRSTRTFEPREGFKVVAWEASCMYIGGFAEDKAAAAPM